jgi:hypothetical protein
MLVRNDVVFILGIDRLVFRRHVDFFHGELDTQVVFHQVGMVGGVEM